MSTIIDLGKIRFQFRGDYSASDLYEYNDVVRYGGDVYCYINATGTTGNDPSNAAYWSNMVSGLKSRGAWDVATQYQINDVVTLGGATYRAIAPTSGSSQRPPNATYWEPLVRGYNHRGDWLTGTFYQADDAVVYLGQAYRALSVHTSDASFLVDLLAGRWERYVAGSTNRGAYQTNTAYFKGDLVQVGTAPNLDHYISTTDHTSDAAADPGTSPEDANWTRLIAGQYTTSSIDRQYAYFMGLSS